MEIDLFGNVIEKKVLLRETFIEPPFSVIDSKSGTWQARKRKWKNLGIKSEVGRDAVSIHIGTKANSDEGSEQTRIFDPALCELMYRWFCPEGGSILDPFAGGSVRGIVANYLGYKYTGIDIRQEQIESNIEQGKEILGDDICEWIREIVTKYWIVSLITNLIWCLVVLRMPIQRFIAIWMAT